MTSANLRIDAWRTFSGNRRHGALGSVLAIDDFERLAKKRLPNCLFSYVSGGAETCWTRDRNRAAFEDWAFVPRVLRNVASRSTNTILLGRQYSLPIGIAPMGIAALSAFDGDVAMARSAERAGVPFILSGASLTAIERVMQEAPGTWFQVYVPGDLDKIEPLIARARGAGVQTLVVTVDVPVAGNRENNVRAGFSTPLRPNVRLALDGLSHPRWTVATLLRTLLVHGMPHFENSFAKRGAPVISRNAERDFARREHLDWSHLLRIREQWDGQLVIKGILSPEDAELACNCGADAIIVSNHGGRQLDGAAVPLRVLPQVKQVAGNTPVMIDGGIRRGSDALKALALGANFVFAGRPFNYAAAVGGEPAIDHALTLFKEELDRNIAMLGVRSIAEIGPELLLPSRP